jgi:hypothetical protein
MKKRIDRSVSLEIRRKISEGLKRYYRTQSEQKKQERNAKQSVAMKRYWDSIPKANNNDPETSCKQEWN